MSHLDQPAYDPAGVSTDQEKKTVAKKDSWWDIIRFALICLAIIIPVRLFIAQPFIVNGQSMDPTFHNGDYLIVDQLSYLKRQPERGEIVIFRPPIDLNKYYIKRIIGLPGETVNYRNGEIYITRPDQTTFHFAAATIATDPTPNVSFFVPPGEYFVLGDNRTGSYDSRVWGSVPAKLIRGRALVRLWPPTTTTYLPGALTDETEGE